MSRRSGLRGHKALIAAVAAAAVFLIDPRGHLVALFQAPHAAERIARDVARIQELEWN